MDDRFISEWCHYVQDGDWVFYLNDFTFRGLNEARAYFGLLSGRIFMLQLPWHHDYKWMEPALVPGCTPILTRTGIVSFLPPLIQQTYPQFNEQFGIKEGHQWGLTACHYPYEQWERQHYGWGHIHGHCHGRLPEKPLRLDVGVDSAKKLLGAYRPFKLEEIVEIFLADVKGMK